MSFGSGSCRDVRIGFTMNRAIMEQCRKDLKIKSVVPSI